jgi:hypothetical protein
MPQVRLPMRKIRDVLRLKAGSARSQIGRAEYRSRTNGLAEQSTGRGRDRGLVRGKLLPAASTVQPSITWSECRSALEPLRMAQNVTGWAQLFCKPEFRPI